MEVLLSFVILGIMIFVIAKMIKVSKMKILKLIIDSILALYEKKETKNVEATANQSSNADELIEYKKLLDVGIISQDEYDTKKKQLLDV